MPLRGQLENPGKALIRVASRLSEGFYERGRRVVEPSMVDACGCLVRSIGKTQAFLSAAEVAELVSLYERGLGIV